MHVFTRQATLARNQIQDGMAYAVEIAGYVTKLTGLEVNTWTTVSIVTAQSAGGKIADAMAWGVDMMQLSAKLTGSDGAVERPELPRAPRPGR